MKQKIFNTLKNYGLVIFIIIVSIIKIISILNIPIYAIAPSSIDDRLMINIGNSLLSKKWLGTYDQFTLVKGMMFPLFLAISHYIGIPYTVATICLYIISSIIFIHMLKNIIKNKYLLGFIFLVLVFNPVTTSINTLSRVYRNCLTPSQVLLIIGCCMQVYFKINEKTKTKYLWAILGGISLASFYNTREDSVWIIPFIMFFIIITIIKILINKEKTKNKLTNVICVFIPCIILIATNTIISTLNYKYYGIYTTNELNNSAFTRAMKNIYAVKNSDNIEYVSVSRKKLEEIYKVSPTMNQLKDNLDNAIEIYMVADRHPSDNEVEDGWFFWCLRHAVSTAGYYDTAQHAEEIYNKISDEIEQAFKEGNLEKQNVMPSALMSPWREGHFEKLCNAFAKILYFVPSYTDVTTEALESIGDGSDGIALFEELTNNKAIYPNDSYKTIYELNVSSYIKRLNLITKVYQKTGIPVAIMGVVLYVLIIIKAILGIRKKEYKYLQIFLVLSGILGSFIVLAVGVSYNEIASCPSINYMYLSGAYPLTISFWTIGVSVFIEEIISKIKSNKIKGTISDGTKK